MQTPSIIHSTFVIERNYPASPERVFAAFADPVQKRRWFAESAGRDVEEFEMDFRVGGAEHAHYRFPEGTPFGGAILTNRTTYQDIVPNRRIVMAYTMAFGEKPFSASLATVELVPNGQGTDVIFTDQGAYFEGADGPQIREKGWSSILDRLSAEWAR